MIHALTNQSDYVLRIDMWDWDGNQSFAEYQMFKVGDENTDYRLEVYGFSGNAGQFIITYTIKLVFML